MTYANPAAGDGRDLSPFIAPPGAARRAIAGGGIHLPSRPAEGWIALALLVVMGLTFGASVDDARWVLGRDGLTDFLPWAVVLGIVWSYVAASAGWSRWVSHGLGAVFAALLLPLIVGASLVEPGNGSLHDWYTATASAVIQAYLDLAAREPGRIRLINAARPLGEVQDDIRRSLASLDQAVPEV